MDMQVIKRQTEAERHADYRQRLGNTYRERDAARKRASRSRAIPEFFGIDSEGIGSGKNHRAVLLSAFNKDGEGSHYTAHNLTRGLQWDEVFEFLYSIYRQKPKAAFTGFYLGYDFNNWLCHRAGFPQKAAESLLTKAGKAARRLPNTRGRSKYRAVKVDRWEVDLLGFKRLSIRPRPVGCYCYENAIKCTHKQLPWMHICDAGSFFQMSLLAVLNKDKWKDDPDGWPLTQAEYDEILAGKNKRATARLDKAMLAYNRLENIVLCRVMERLARGFAAVNIKIAKDQWYGPGATASKWLQLKGAPKRTQLRQKQGKQKPLMPKWFWEIAHASYYGGWFEIFSHGLVGTGYNYDINNAYPYASTKLPHICGACQYKRGRGDYSGNGNFVLVYATVFTRGDRIGAVPYRDKEGSILRPRVAKGWYWLSEINAADRAGLVKKVMCDEWVEFVPCNHPDPFTDIARLYQLRLEVGKDSAQGMAIKLNNNSIYGKFAQSIGSAPYGNWLYASYITSHCRTQILDAIASHPYKADSVLMVATDGICFDSPHPTLPISKALGAWAFSVYNDLVLFKPGVYWHRQGKEALLKVKSRGVPRDEFMEACEQAEAKFYGFSLHHMYPEFILETWEEFSGEKRWLLEAIKVWPSFKIPVKFRMRSCLQALQERNWNGSGEVLDEVQLLQDSDPQSKRRKPFWNDSKNRIDTVIHDLSIKQLLTTYHGDAIPPKRMLLGFGLDGETAFGPILEAAASLRDSVANYDLPVDESQYEWETVWG